MTDMDWIPEEPPSNRSHRSEAPIARDAAPRSRRRANLFDARRQQHAALYTGAALAAVAVLGSIAWLSARNGSSITEPLPRASTISKAVSALPPPNLLKPVSPEEATKENSERPFVNRPDTPAGRFVLRTDADDRDRALTCLTQAVYYEAGGEGVDGGRAVAQVVLNRMRHPGYPASVCGVVYQGAERANACQFTFACDGSLLRVPAASLWARSRKIAQDALAGKVFAQIGHATHYHADYVLPYWADSLDKTVQIGHHIFYRLRSVLGDSRSFFQHYAGKEPSPPQPADAVTVAPADPTEALASALASDALKNSVPEVEKAAPAISPLLVDSAAATLIVDGAGTVAVSKKKKIAKDCVTTGDGTKIVPLGANDMRASAGSC